MAFPPKKIAIVSDSIYPYFKGGKEKRIYEIATRLATQEYDVTLYSMKWWRGNNIKKESGVTLHAISPLYPLYHGKRRSIKEAVFFSLNCFKLLNKKFDVIEVDHMPHLVLFPLKIVCLIKRKKMIVTWHEVWGREYWKEYLGPGIKAWIAYMVELTSARLPDLIISVSQHTTKSLRNDLGITGPITTIHNGEAAAAGADIIFAGRLLSHKNVDVLLRAISMLTKEFPTISAWIIGEGPERKSLEALSAELHIENNVSFLGFLPDQNDLYRVMKASIIFVLPSTREGFGIAALEANACGMPVITIDHEKNATKELVIDGENGLLVSLNATQLAHAIKTLLNSRKDRLVYQAYAKKYNWDNAATEVKKIYTV
jgi:glycosyltransferase involved in cell wall biosynthesis